MSKIQEDFQYEYGCEDKKYFVSFYINSANKQERFGCTSKVYGTIENFQPRGQTAIKDTKGDMWLIDSKLIEMMRPASNLELKNWSVLLGKPIIRGREADYCDRIPCKRLLYISDIFIVETECYFVVIKNRRDKDVYTQDFTKIHKSDFDYNDMANGYECKNILVCL